MALNGNERFALAVFDEQVVDNNTTYYTDIISLNEYSILNVNITSSGTVDSVFTLQTRSRPAPTVGVWENQDDGYWFNESTTISGAAGNGVKQVDSVNITNVGGVQARLKMDVISGGTLAVHATLK